MRVIFMGTPAFAVETLNKIIKAGHEVITVFTQPDKPKGRGKSVQFTPVKEVAIAHNIPVVQPIKIRETEQIELIKELKPEVIVVVAFGQIIPKAILDIPYYGCINVHASLLPKYRGAAPIQWAIIDGESETGITTMRMDTGLDTGDMILKEKVPISEKETNENLFEKLGVIGGDLLIQTLEQIQSGTAIYEKQGESPTPYAKMIQKDMGLIDWNKEASVIERQIRGMNPWPSAYTHLGDKTLKIWAADVIADTVENSERQPGEILLVDKKNIVVKAKNGALALTEIQLEGKKRMSTEAFLLGYKVSVGEVLKYSKE
jgi:methionyl-tRNA formyltransferase